MATEVFALGVRLFSKSGPAEIVMHGAIDDPTGTSEVIWAAAILDAIDDGVPPVGLLNRLCLLMSEDAFVSSAYCSRISLGGGNQAQVLYQPEDFPGAFVGTYSASQVAGCVIWISIDAEAKTGRNFIPFVPDSELNGGRFSTEYQTRMQNFIDTVVAGLSTAVGTFKFGFWNQADQLIYETTNGYLSRKVGTQRRREVPL